MAMPALTDFIRLPYDFELDEGPLDAQRIMEEYKQALEESQRITSKWN